MRRLRAKSLGSEKGTSAGEGPEVALKNALQRLRSPLGVSLRNSLDLGPISGRKQPLEARDISLLGNLTARRLELCRRFLGKSRRTLPTIA